VLLDSRSRMVVLWGTVYVVSRPGWFCVRCMSWVEDIVLSFGVRGSLRVLVS